MTLTIEELQLLAYHAQDNRLLRPYIEANDWDSLAAWYAQEATANLEMLLGVLSAEERSKLFAYTDFQPWYSQLCAKIAASTVAVPNGMTVETIDDISLLLLKAIIDYGLTSHSLQELVTTCFERNLLDAAQYLLISFYADGIFNHKTYVRLGVEMGVEARWQNLGLSSAPTATEIASVLNPPA